MEASGVTPRLHRQIFDIVSAQIDDGSLLAGQILHEARLAAAFGVSRAPVRQAMAALAAAGRIAKEEAQGYRVVGDQAGATEDGAMPAATPVRKLSTTPSWETIYQVAERAIAARMALGSWHINESEMARFHGVSRTVVREVLARLQERGLVRKDGRSRWLAPALDADYVGELYQMRWVLEPVALLSALPSVSREQLDALRANLLAAQANATALTGPDLDRLESEMHVELLSGCQNASLSAAIRLYQSLLVAHTFLYDRMPRLFPIEPFIAEHLDVAERLCAGFPEEATRYLEAHLQASRDRAIERIRQVSSLSDIDHLLEKAPYALRIG